MVGNLDKSSDTKGSPQLADNFSDDLPTSYWGIIAEIDATIFCIEDSARKMTKRPPIYQMIDEATGYDKEQHELLKHWSDRLKQLVALLPADDPHLKPTQGNKERDL